MCIDKREQSWLNDKVYILLEWSKEGSTSDVDEN